MTQFSLPSQNELLQKLVKYHRERNLGHLGSCLSCFDILYFLFSNQIQPEDHFILSKGHAVSLLYLILHEKGVLSLDDHHNSCTNGARFGAHPPFMLKSFHNWMPFGSGSLGYGLGLAAGIALQKKAKQDDSKIYVLVSEGDLNEGSSLESLQFIAQHKLHQVVICLDHNKFQAVSPSSHLINIEAIKKFLEALGFKIWEGSGHTQVTEGFHLISRDKPTFLVFHTLKNKYFETQLNPLQAHYQSSVEFT
jgi:transketolase